MTKEVIQQNNKYSYHPGFVMRTPLIPLKKEPITVDKLFVYTQQSFFKEAIYLASPILHDELTKWHNGETTSQKDIDKLVISLYKYYSRMQSRCTPYGLFAGCTVGTWGEKNDIILDALRRHTRLDMNFLCALAQNLSQHPSVLPFLQFFPNNSIYLVGQQLRYVEYKYVNNKRVHQISSIENNSYIQIVLEKAQKGAITGELAQSLLDDEITLQDSHDFIKELIASQVLVSNIEPAVTGDEFIHHIIKVLQNINTTGAIESIVTLLKTVLEEISILDENPENEIALYRTIYDQLKELGIPIEENFLFQTDLYKTAKTAELNSTIQGQLNEAIDFLNKFTRDVDTSSLKAFKEKFHSRYEGAEMPLLEILDTESGIGYPENDTTGVNALLNDLYISNKESGSHDLKWNKQEEMLHSRLLEASINKDYTVKFTEDFTKETGGKSSALPDSSPLMFRVISKDKIYFQGTGGSSSANLLGRFAHGDYRIFDIITNITEHEQKVNGDKLLAEIVHLPESRIGNILLRPVLRRYEIPYLGKSVLPAENQIHLQDLMISLRDDKIILRSKRLNQEVIPRLSTAHNYSFNALPVYRFLCDLQTQYFEKSGIGFNWGALSGQYSFLPRAEFKNVVISRAKWQLKKEDFNILFNANQVDTLKEANKWRTLLNMPQFIVLADNDNELLINFEDQLSINMFVSTIKNRDRITIEEYLFDANDLLVKDAHGNGYTNEFIAIRLNNTDIQPSSSNLITSPSQNTVQRDFYLGSEWLYYKIYSGVKTADKLLAEVIKPLTEEITSKELADRFFFLRYNDPETHIRLRFHVKDISNLGAIISLVHQYLEPCINTGMIHKVQTDMYKRELERYGDNSIDLTEDFFHIDSVTVINLLNSVDSDETGNRILWQFALLSIDELLDAFHYSLAGKLHLLE
ncbi:MAG TPA: lantibiotic dehydratase, partial [Bacteroidia bacterium]|nr:lantibiotic dehydratase [Bacteroidia bacterium]